MKNPIFVKSLVLTVFVAIFIAATVLAMRPQFVGTRAGKADENYLESEKCLACHTNHFESWDKTHHSKMTQEATENAVVGDFERNNTFEYLGVKSKMERRGADFYMTFNAPDGKTDVHKIVKTIGSRRMQQYVAKTGANHIRLPIAWDIENQRWMSLNGSFFYPDGENFNQHTAQWDLNCVFCHNVKAQPNFNFQTKQAKTEVAELGIACGACHGETADHAQNASSPITRTIWHLDETAERNVVHPQKIDAERSLMICGHCHGQRVPTPDNRIREVLTTGDPFDAGENLAEFYKPVHAETKIGQVSFESRFWADGSPRLTAYEYQGVTNSPCFLDAKQTGSHADKITCLSCHTMHDGDIKGQIKPEMRTNQACTQCHEQFTETAALKDHTKHAPDSSASNCYSCHMPEVVFGVMSFHRTHQISNPQPELTATKSVPNACNQCHIDKSVNWAIAETKNLWGGNYMVSQVSPDAQFDQPEGARMLFAGDALERAWAAEMLRKHAAPDFAAPLLSESFATENYPIVRFFAANGLTQNNKNLPKPDYLAAPTHRAEQINLWLNAVSDTKRAEIQKAAEQLRTLRKNVDLEVGE